MDDGVCVMAVTFCLIRAVRGVVASVLVCVLKEQFGILCLICREDKLNSLLKLERNITAFPSV